MLLQLSICTFNLTSEAIEALQPSLDRARYSVTHCSSEDEFVQYVETHKHQIDCAVLEDSDALRASLARLNRADIVLPAAILTDDPSRRDPPLDRHNAEGVLYHNAEVFLPRDRPDCILDTIDRAIDRFLKLSQLLQTSETRYPESEPSQGATDFLLQKQQRLANKLRERLGYLGVYYKRNPDRFLRNLPAEEQEELLQDIQTLYRDIVLSYFSEDVNLNQAIDEFVNIAFFADISVTHIVEIHMELMDEFSKQLQLEGRSEEILLDYRLTLIDTIAHLCEMYRRSIPRDS